MLYSVIKKEDIETPEARLALLATMQDAIKEERATPADGKKKPVQYVIVASELADLPTHLAVPLVDMLKNVSKTLNAETPYKQGNDKSLIITDADERVKGLLHAAGLGSDTAAFKQSNYAELENQNGRSR